MSTRRPSPFDDLWPHIDRIKGWLTRQQGLVLYGLSQQPGARVVEIGSHHGRSTVLCARAGAKVFAVDPFVTARLFDGATDREHFLANVRHARVEDQVTLIESTSRRALAAWSHPDLIDLVYVDGKHDMLSLIHDLRWRRFVRPGGHLAVHDAFSSLGVTAGVLATVPFARDLALLSRTGSLIVLVKRAPTVRERIDVLRHLPWFVRNLAVKVLLRARWLSAARRLGHTDTYDPY